MVSNINIVIMCDLLQINFSEMSGNEHFCLRWNDFESNISHAFQTIREEKDFFDVTLGM